MAKQAKRLATDYLSIGDLVTVPTNIPAPIVYSESKPNGEIVRTGRIAERLASGAVAVEFAPGKIWDYSNREALQFSRVF